jgi:queuine tRNA-ribosyltransferase
MKFTIQGTDNQSNARAGLIETDHGSIFTPIFMPVGTAGSVKAVHFRDLDEGVHARIILGNTYHLFLRPGITVLEAAGGLHRFIGWEKPILTDSGGYQVYSLAGTRKLTEEGVTFQSHIDGSKHIFTPENVMDIQRSIGADIIMAFDECPPHPSSKEYVKKSMELTHRWLDRCLDRFNSTAGAYGYSQSLFPIVQGGTFPELRKQSAELIARKEAEGNAIGGLSVGEPEEEMYTMTDLVCQILPSEKPRYLMGVGTPANMIESISLGVDMFDCVMPTRNGRNGMIFTSQGILNMKNEKWKKDFSPLDDLPVSPVSQTCSRAYLRHLVTAGEILGPMIASLHNLGFYLWLMEQARNKILDGTFSNWKSYIVPRISQRL